MIIFLIPQRIPIKSVVLVLPGHVRSTGKALAAEIRRRTKSLYQPASEGGQGYQRFSDIFQQADFPEPGPPPRRPQVQLGGRRPYSPRSFLSAQSLPSGYHTPTYPSCSLDHQPYQVRIKRELLYRSQPVRWAFRDCTKKASLTILLLGF